jgi:lipopolysaccharide exporter
MLITRSLRDQHQFGIWVLFLSITGIFETSKVNLLKNAHVKYVSGSQDVKEKTMIASSSFIINFCISLLFILLIFFFSDWFSAWLNIEKELAVMLKWFVPGLLCMVFFSHLEAIQQSHLDFKGIFAGYFVRQIFFFLVIVAYKLLNVPLSLTSLVIYQSISIILGSIVLYFYSRKYMVYQFLASKLWIKKIMGYGGYIFGSGFAANIYSNLDQMMIAKFITAGSVAPYGVAFRINNMIDIPSYAAADIIFPKTSRASVEEGPGKVTYLFERMVAILIAINLPLTIFIILFAKPITVIIAGNAYATAAPIVLQLYMIASIFRPVQNQAANLLNSIGKPRLVFLINTSTLIVLLAINYLCLLQFGFYGVAIGTMITSLLGFILWYYVMKAKVNINISNIIRYTGDTYKLIYRQVMGLIRKQKTDIPAGE